MVVTRDDVAQRAGVSAAVVSYVVNNGPRPVSDRSRQRVLDAIAELGYRPDAIARSFRTGRSRALGLLVPDVANPFFAELTKWLEDELFRRDYALLVGSASDDPERQRAYVQNLSERRVDGILLISKGSESELRSVIAMGIPVVVLDRVGSHLPVSTISVDNAGGAAAATRHLLDHGYERIDCIGGPNQLNVAGEREAGWRRALADAEVDYEPRIRRSDFSREGGYAATRWLIERDDRPRAIFVASDIQGVGALAAIHEAGLSAPDDVAVISFDGTEAARYTVPSLACVAQPIARMAAIAAEALITGVGVQHYNVEWTLLPRASCGCA